MSFTDKNKDAKVAESIYSTDVAEIHTVSSGSKTGGWFRRNFIDGFKPPADNSEFADLTATERARLFLNRTEPKLSRRHLMVIALAAYAGTGLFIGSGTSLKVAGPAALMIGFGVLGLAIICTICCLGEMGLRYPTVNVCYELPARFLHPSVGFAIGYIYFMAACVSAPTETIALTELIQFWSKDDNAGTRANPAAWAALMWGLDVIIQLAGSRLYGEIEFIVGLIKVSGVAGFIIFSVINVCGGPPTGHYIGAHNFHDPGAFLHSFKGVVQTLVSCSFAYGGAELIGIAAAETSNPIRSIPSGVRQTFWRIAILFLLSIFMVCLMVPADTPGLGNSSTGSGSPFVIALELTGVKALPSIFNSVLMCSVFGVSNSCLYTAARTLTSLSLKGVAPRCFCYIDRNGRPLVSIASVLAFMLIGFVVASDKGNDVFNWLYAFASLGYLYAWAGLTLSYIRYRYCMMLQKGSLSELVWKSPLGMAGAIFGFAVMIGTLGLQFWVYLFPIGSDPDPQVFFQNELSVPFFIILAVGHKLWKRKEAVFVSNRELDLDSGMRDFNIDDLKEIVRRDKEKARKNFFHFISTYIC